MLPSLMAEVARRKRGFQSGTISWARQNLRKYPWREHRTPYSVFVAEVLLKRTTAAAVLKIYSKFVETYPSMQELARADLSDLENLLEAIGYHKLRASALKEMADSITNEHDGVLPRSREALLKVRHIGQYTAGAILSLGYGVPSAMVDSNVERILRRFFCSYLPPKGSLRAIQSVAESLVPEKQHQLYNLGLVDLGALVCRYDRPHHDLCPLRELCDCARQETDQSSV